jgi:hypothetical protein
MKRLPRNQIDQDARSIARRWQATYGQRNLRRIYLATRKEVLRILNESKGPVKQLDNKQTPV